MKVSLRKPSDLAPRYHYQHRTRVGLMHARLSCQEMASIATEQQGN